MKILAYVDMTFNKYCNKFMFFWQKQVSLLRPTNENGTSCTAFVIILVKIESRVVVKVLIAPYRVLRLKSPIGPHERESAFSTFR